MRKNAKKFVTLTCENEGCKKVFEREAKEYRRCYKKGYPTACSRSCGAVLRNHKHAKGNLANLRSRQDEFSSFRYFMNKARAKDRAHYGKTDIDVAFLRELWQKQDGTCPYTGIKMELPHNTQSFHIKGTPCKASLDRIDSSKGYVRGNVEFVCLAVNYAKNGFSKEQMLEFFSRVVKLDITQFCEN